MRILKLLFVLAVVGAESLCASAPMFEESQDYEERPHSHYTEMPDDIWGHVGSYLKTDEVVLAMDVNRHWCRAFRALKAQKALLYPCPLPVAFESLKCFLSQTHRQHLTLNLELQRITTEQMQELSPYLGGLRRCVLELCYLDERLMAQFSAAAPDLRELSLIDCRPREAHALYSLRHLKHLVKLGVSQTQVDDEFIVQLAEAGLPLRDFSLSYSKGVTSRGFQALAAFTTLESLSLVNTDMNSDDLLVLVAALKLKKLDVSECKSLSSTALIQLRHMTSLRELNVAWTPVDDSILEAWGTSLLSLVELRASLLYGISHRGIRALAPLRSLRRLKLPLHHLVQMSDDYAVVAQNENALLAAMGEAGLQLEEIEASGIFTDPRVAARCLVQMTSLKALKLGTQWMTPDDFLSICRALTGLRQLEMVSVRFHEQTYACLSYLHHLTSVDLRLSSCTDGMISQMPSWFPHLKELKLKSCVYLTDAFFNHLSRFHTLTSLSVNSGQFTGQGLIALSQCSLSLKRLTVGLDLMTQTKAYSPGLLSSPSFTDPQYTNALLQFRALTTLESLNCSEYLARHVTDAVIEAWSTSLCQVRDLSISSCLPITRASVDSFMKMPLLRSLNVEGAPLSEDDLMPLVHSRPMLKIEYGQRSNREHLSAASLVGCGEDDSWEAGSGSDASSDADGSGSESDPDSDLSLESDDRMSDYSRDDGDE